MRQESGKIALAYACTVAGYNGLPTLVIAGSAGKAKSRYRRNSLYDLEIPFTAIRCRCLGRAATHALDDNRVERTAHYRGLPFVRAGMAIEVEGRRGRIITGNDSSNWDVLFDGGPDFLCNCHPTWETRYFDEAGTVLADFRKEKGSAMNEGRKDFRK